MFSNWRMTTRSAGGWPVIEKVLLNPPAMYLPPLSSMAFCAPGRKSFFVTVLLLDGDFINNIGGRRCSACRPWIAPAPKEKPVARASANLYFACMTSSRDRCEIATFSFQKWHPYAVRRYSHLSRCGPKSPMKKLRILRTLMMPSSQRSAQARTVGCRQRPYHQGPEATAAARFSTIG